MAESQGYKKKKPTKAEAMASISEYVETTLKNGFVLNITQGFEIANPYTLTFEIILSNHL